MYRNTFAIDKIPNSERIKNKEVTPQYYLKNYDYHIHKLESDFYYRCFLGELLFTTSILEIDDFIFTHISNSKNTIEFLKILNRMVIPDIDRIILNAKMPETMGTITIKKTDLTDGFTEYNGIIDKFDYTYDFYYYKTFTEKLSNDLNKRKLLIEAFLSKHQDSAINKNNLKWTGKTSHLAFIIKNLIDKGYIEAPKKNDLEINYTKLSRQIINSFEIKSPKVNTLRPYLSSDTQQYQDISHNFNEQGFEIPDSYNM